MGSILKAIDERYENLLDELTPKIELAKANGDVVEVNRLQQKLDHANPHFLAAGERINESYHYNKTW